MDYDGIVVGMSEDHSLRNERELQRLQAHEMVQWFPLPTLISLTDSPSDTNSKDKRRITRTEPCDRPGGRDSFVDAHTTHTARTVIEYGADFTTSSKRMSARRGAMNSPPSDAGVTDDVINDMSSNGRMSMSHLADLNLVASAKTLHPPLEPIVAEISEDDQYIVAPLIHQQSFIAKRINSRTSSIGPIALFSRHDVSVTMTRSLGDRHSARTCDCAPEITKFILPTGKGARFILGSDGLFDVMTSERVCKKVRFMTNTEEASRTLVRKAREYREHNKLRMDDISCVVVDINPTSRLAGGEGGCCIIN